MPLTMAPDQKADIRGDANNSFTLEYARATSYCIFLRIRREINIVFNADLQTCFYGSLLATRRIKNRQPRKTPAL